MKNKNMDFLNDKRTPTPEMVFEAFALSMPDNTILKDNQYINEIPDEEWGELQEPHDIKTIEGSEWEITRLLWNTAKGVVVKFEIVKLNDNFNDIIDADYEDIDFLSEENIDYNFKKNHEEMLNEALENEQYIEAAYLRDWMKNYDNLYAKLNPLMKEAMDNEDFEMLSNYLITINDYIVTL